MVIQESMSMEQKLSILADAAKYDVACTSSGVDRGGKEGSIGSAIASGICHTFSADGRCISLLKILFTNECIYDCKYCINRASNDVPRTTFTPEEVCSLTMEFYRRNYIEGLFLSSGILHTPNYTMELIVQTLRMLRTTYNFNGYIHCKAIPGADRDLIELAGWYADRMSVNLELPTADGLKRLAPHKNRKNILNPIRQIQDGIEESQTALGMMGGNKGAYWHTRRKLEGKSIEAKRAEDHAMYVNQYTPKKTKQEYEDRILPENSDGKLKNTNINDTENKNTNKYEVKNNDIKNGNIKNSNIDYDIKNSDVKNRNINYDTKNSDIKSNSLKHYNTMNGDINDNHSNISQIVTRNSQTGLTRLNQFAGERGFVPAGQSTQMIIGATNESDYEIVSVAEALYQRFDLKRVFYSAFIRVNDDSSLPVLQGGPPLLREHRLYQADWLLRYYGFEAGELLTKERPNFNVFLDPKCNWAIGHLEQFPIEVNKADYYTLLRVPGIGPKSAGRIVGARRTATLKFEDLKKMGVVLKRAIYFITCNGQMMYPTKIEENYITNQLLNVKEKLPRHLIDPGITYEQLSLFDHKNFANFVG